MKFKGSVFLLCCLLFGSHSLAESAFDFSKAISIDRDRFEIAEQYGFAGLVYKDGKIWVLKVAKSKSGRSVFTEGTKISNDFRLQLSEKILKDSAQWSKQDITSKLIIEQVDFSYAELARWKILLESRRGTSAENVIVHFAAINEVTNQIDIGVDATSNIETLKSFLSQKGVPPKALNIKVSSKITPAIAGPTTPPQNNTYDYVRPLLSGLELDVRDKNNSNVFGTCTYGLSVLTGSAPAFFSALHCLPIYGNNTILGQPSNSYQIGYLASFSSIKLNAKYQGGSADCPNTYDTGGKPYDGCNYVDVFLGKLNSGISYVSGGVANLPSGTWGPFNPNAPLYVQKVSADSELAIGQTVVLYGRSTGKSSGPIQYTGFLQVAPFAMRGTSPGDPTKPFQVLTPAMVCAKSASSYSPAPGDSGSGVFVPTSTGLSWAGILSTVFDFNGDHYFCFSKASRILKSWPDVQVVTQGGGITRLSVDTTDPAPAPIQVAP